MRGTAARPSAEQANGFDVRGFGARLRAARRRHRLTQAELAARAGIGVDFYGKLERAEMTPSVGTFRRLCVALRVSADELLGFPAAGRLLPPDDPPALRRLLRRLRRADPSAVRVVSTFLVELEKLGKT